ncbi:MAG TPA: DUF4118 domain-containing protein [Acidimicrobiales bacterium]
MKLFEKVRTHPTLWTLAAALLVPLGVAASFVPFRASFTNVGAALVLVALIEGIAIVGRRLGGLVATVSAVLWFDFFLAPPYEQFTISHRPDLETTITLVVVGIIVTELAARSRRHRRIAGDESAFVATLSKTAANVAAGVDPAQVIADTCATLATILSLRECHFETETGTPYAQIHDDGSVIHVGMRWPANDYGIPGPRSQITCRWRHQELGRFVLTPTPGLAVSKEQRIVAASLVNVVASLVHAQRHDAHARRDW